MERHRLDDSGWFRLEPSGRTPAFFSRREPATVDSALVQELKAIALRDQTDVRICLHASPDAAYHDMVIVRRLGVYERPHRGNVDKTWHMIEGEMAVFVFDDDGSVVDAQRLSADGVFMYRVAAGMFNSIVPLTEVAVFHESKPGPFVRGVGNTPAPWAPAEDDVDAVRRHTDDLLRRADGV